MNFQFQVQGLWNHQWHKIRTLKWNNDEPLGILERGKKRLTTALVAKFLGVRPRQVQRWVECGKLNARDSVCGCGHTFTFHDVCTFLRSERAEKLRIVRITTTINVVWPESDVLIPVTKYVPGARVGDLCEMKPRKKEKK
jgi:hypothetical protein